MRPKAILLVALAIGVFLLPAGTARAQTVIFPFLTINPDEGEFGISSRSPDTAIRFNFSTPGARSLGMGGAFLALADDATAAYTNPAGLTNLTVGGSEVAVEVRQHEFTGTFLERGHYNTEGKAVTLSREGLDFVEGLQLDEATSETGGLSFLSFAYVLPRGFTVALYRHELANFESGFENQGAFSDNALPDLPSGLRRVTPERSSINADVVNYGLSGAFAFDIPSIGGMESNLSLGFGLSYYELEFDALRELFTLCRFVGSAGVDGVCQAGDPDSRLPGGFHGAADFGDDHSLFLVKERGEDDDFGVNLGFLWKLGRLQRWSIGGVFRQGPQFETQQESSFRILFPQVVNDVPGPVLLDFPLDDETGQVTVPDVWGLGLAFRTGEGRTKMTFDVNRVRYSQTLGDFTAGLDLESADFEIPNVTQVHLGFERIVLVEESLFVGTARFGAWHEPFHDPTYIGIDPDLSELYRRPQDDEIHLSVGVGLVIKEDYQIDAAVDYSDPVTTVSFSLVKFL